MAKRCLLFHKWNDGCKCIRCGETRPMMHSWNGCVCTVCKATRDVQHSFKCGVCTGCGASEPSKGHFRTDYPELKGDTALWLCKYCGYLMQQESIKDLNYRLREEIKDADRAGCNAPRAVAICDMIMHHREQLKHETK